MDAPCPDARMLVVIVRVLGLGILENLLSGKSFAKQTRSQKFNLKLHLHNSIKF